MSNTQLAMVPSAPQTQLAAPMEFQEMVQIGKIMAASGFFKDIQGEAQAVVKILAGVEYGMQPFSAMQNIHLIQGKPTLAANAMAAAVKASPKYDYQVAQLDDEACEITFYQTGIGEIGHSRFTREDAQKAGTQNMQKFGRNMMFARAMSNGVRWYCPDVFKTAVYTPEEMGAVVDGDGAIISVPAEKENFASQNLPDEVASMQVHNVAEADTELLRTALARIKAEMPTHWQKREIAEELHRRAERLKQSQQQFSQAQPEASQPATDTPAPDNKGPVSLHEAVHNKGEAATGPDPEADELFSQPDTTGLSQAQINLMDTTREAGIEHDGDTAHPDLIEAVNTYRKSLGRKAVAAISELPDVDATLVTAAFVNNKIKIPTTA